MRERVLRTISRYRMLAPGERAIVAVSGGADSVCLLYVLLEIGVAVSGVAHFNHKLRGEDSDLDERFAANLADRLALPFFRSEGIPAKGNLEQEARKARRAFFVSLMREGVGGRVALAHTRDDQAETVLFRLLRGSGLAGLAGVHPVTGDGFIRPLIGVTRGEVLEYLGARGIAWREDRSNRDLRFARNRIRHELLPQLAREWNPKIADSLANLADLAYEEEQYWDRELRTGQGKDESVVFAPHAGSRAVARREIRRAIQRVKGDLRGIDFEHVERVIEGAGARFDLPGVRISRLIDRLRVERAGSQSEAPALEVTVPGTYPSPDGASEIRLQPCDNLKSEISAPLILRGWRPGDHYRPVGKSRDQKLREMFRKAGVASWERRSWPILDYGGKIIWTRRFGPVERCPVCVTETLRLHQ